MLKETCKRCGCCCLASPCMVIPIGEEKFVIIDGLKIHKCLHLSFQNNVASCNVKEQVLSKDHKCTSNKSQDFYRYMKQSSIRKKIIHFYKEKTI